MNNKTGGEACCPVSINNTEWHNNLLLYQSKINGNHLKNILNIEYYITVNDKLYR